MKNESKLAASAILVKMMANLSEQEGELNQILQKYNQQLRENKISAKYILPNCRNELSMYLLRNRTAFSAENHELFLQLCELSSKNGFKMLPPSGIL